VPKITIHETAIVVEREEGDPKFYGVKDAKGESNFLHWLKGILNKPPYSFDLIKKRMWKDGHMMDNLQQYLRTRKQRKGAPYMMIWNGNWQINGIEEDWNAGKCMLRVERGVGGED
jgi:hypothetical protein